MIGAEFVYDKEEKETGLSSKYRGSRYLVQILNDIIAAERLRYPVIGTICSFCFAKEPQTMPDTTNASHL